ncbi:acyltransferase family protein [Pseudonocardia zijingensis]|uniref:acyltransferase family protein n=2 Tax=Pseudonocardia zijingensis TaxID=153376 RepID=UPI00361185D4
MTIPRPAATPSGTRTASSGEIRGLTGLRAVAAVWVVLFHFHFTPLPGVAEVAGVLGPLVTSGALGVDLFFVLSGFVIAHTYLDELGPGLRVRGTVRFLWARACRLWPVYLLVLHVFGAWLILRATLDPAGPIAFQAVQPVLDVGQYLQQLVLVQLWDDPYFDGASWVGSTWSISAEWLAYLLFPVAALVLFRMRRLPLAVLAGGSVLLMVPMAWSYLALGSPYFPWSWLVRILCGFGAGALAYLVVRGLRRTQAVRRVASVVAAVVPVVVAAGLLLGELAGPGRGGAVIVLFPVLVAALAVADRGPAMLLSTRVFGYGGRLSYGLYLVHIPLFEVYWFALERTPWLAAPTIGAHAVGVVVLLSTPAVAAWTYHLVEEPSRRRLRALAPAVERLPLRLAIALQLLRARPIALPDVAASSDGALATAAARFAAKREAHARLAGADAGALSQPRHAASPLRPATLATALAKAQHRRAAHRKELDLWADYERAEYIRGGYLHAGF